jgi:hypothetical protein
VASSMLLLAHGGCMLLFAMPDLARTPLINKLAFSTYLESLSAYLLPNAFMLAGWW